jgi:UDP-hydrolysing UDP-N-acetyl-D-glucosamine 2-epimerase
MKKVAVYVGSRANYSSALSIMSAIKAHPALQLQLVVAGAAVLQRFGDIRETLRQDGFYVDVVTNTLVEGEVPGAMAKSVGLGVIEFTMALEQLSPNYVVAIGDRFDVLSWVLAASLMNIPVAHTMGGERSGTIDESIRHGITKFSNIHFPANSDAANRILKMGEDSNSVHVVGCPRIDYVLNCVKRIRQGELLSSNLIFDLYKGVGTRFDLCSEPFLLVSFHPVTTEFGSNSLHVGELLAALDTLRMNTIMLWPNADAGSDEISKALRVFRESRNPSWLHLFVNLPIHVYVQLMHQCACMVGNSSSAIREGETVGVPAVNIGSRQNMRLKGLNIIDVPPNRDAIVEAIQLQIGNGHYESAFLYGNGGAGERIAEVLATTSLSTTQKVNTY